MVRLFVCARVGEDEEKKSKSKSKSEVYILSFLLSHSLPVIAAKERLEHSKGAMTGWKGPGSITIRS
jgi:hypothetical protein